MAKPQALSPGERVRLIRQGIGLSQQELARRLAVHPSILSRLERGRLDAWPKLRRQVAGQLGVTEETLFGSRER
jgi:transcriptional regulator with XRE-family HTH domain